jgi:CHAT domain-containing protein
MLKNLILIFLFLCLLSFFTIAQGITSNGLWQRLNSKELLKLSKPDQLTALLKYESASQFSPYRNDSTRVLLLQKISKLCMDTKAYSHAKYYALKAVSIDVNNPGRFPVNPASEIKSYYILARVYDCLKKTNEKNQAYDSCIAVAKRLQVTNELLLYSLLEKVKYFNNNGDYHSCISQAELGETFSRKFDSEKETNSNGDSTWYSLAFAVQKANALIALQKFDDVELFLSSKIEECRKGNAKEYFGVLYELIAITNMQQKNYDKSFAYFNQALKYYSAQKDTLSYKVSLHNIGYLYSKIYKDDNKVLSYYKKSLNYVVHNSNRSRLDSINSINIYSNIGNVYARRGNFDSAQRYFQYAFNQIKSGSSETEILNSSLDEFIGNQNDYLTDLFINKGSAFYKQYVATKNPFFIDEAIRIFRLTDRLLERIKTNQFELQSKLFWRKITHPFYDLAIEACITAGRTEDAWYFFERSRAILLYDQVKEQRGLSGADILKQQDLNTKITENLKAIAAGDHDSPNLRNLEIRLSDLKDQRNQLLQQIKIRNPLYFNNFLDSNFTNLSETRRRLLVGRCLVEIFEGDSSVYAMIITPSEINFNRINKAAYDSALNSCSSYISNRALANSKSHFHSFIKTSQTLYNLIFQNKKLPDGPIIISPDGRYFPFEALVTSVVNNEPVYFLQKHAVSYTYSARYLMSQFSSNTSFVPGDFLGIAPVRFPPNENLPALTGSDLAIKDIEPFFNNAAILLGEHATKNNFLKNFGAYQVIQLFSHSSELSSRGEPVIYFKDEPLYISDLNNIKTPATKLIVLSACETGKGQVYKGEGVFSFNRAFAAIGIPSCINNLWSVDDQTTYTITNLFYKYLSRGVSIDEALQRAKLEFIKNASAISQAPYYWAATVLSGKADAIEFKGTSSNSLFTTIIIIAITLTLLFLTGKFVSYKKNSAPTTTGSNLP